MSIMVEEGVRRLRNAARGLDWERSRAVMETWSRKLRRSGYPATLRHEMIGASVRRYEKMCEEEDNGGRPVHRSREWKAKERLTDSKGAEENQLAQGQRGSDLSALDIGPNLWDHEQGDEGGDQEVRGGDRLESPSS